MSQIAKLLLRSTSTSEVFFFFLPPLADLDLGISVRLVEPPYCSEILYLSGLLRVKSLFMASESSEVTSKALFSLIFCWMKLNLHVFPRSRSYSPSVRIHFEPLFCDLSFESREPWELRLVTLTSESASLLVSPPVSSHVAWFSLFASFLSGVVSLLEVGWPLTGLGTSSRPSRTVLSSGLRAASSSNWPLTAGITVAFVNQGQDGTEKSNFKRLKSSLELSRYESETKEMSVDSFVFNIDWFSCTWFLYALISLQTMRWANKELDTKQSRIVPTRYSVNPSGVEWHAQCFWVACRVSGWLNGCDSEERVKPSSWAEADGTSACRLLRVDSRGRKANRPNRSAQVRRAQEGRGRRDRAKRGEGKRSSDRPSANLAKPSGKSLHSSTLKKTGPTLCTWHTVLDMYSIKIQYW